MEEKPNNSKETGALGEKVVVTYLIEHGYSILDTNYWRKWGELDIIAEKDGKVHFVEVKTFSYDSKEDLNYALTHESWRPEEQVHKFKMGQIAKALQTWIAEKKYEGEWQIDVMGVRIVPHETFATVNFIENVVTD
jgi:Holliday junction resolvase-like predicted endonuclease